MSRGVIRTRFTAAIAKHLENHRDLHQRNAVIRCEQRGPVRSERERLTMPGRDTVPTLAMPERSNRSVVRGLRTANAEGLSAVLRGADTISNVTSAQDPCGGGYDMQPVVPPG